METYLDSPLGAVLADPTQMHQVLMNLVVNARDAMPRGGRLTIATSHAHVEDGDAVNASGTAPGHYLLLSVADTGTGIEAEAREHIFDPFFTTKASGEGTGLGLATVYGIVQQCGGSITFRSEIDRGTTFLVFLPRTGIAAPTLADALSPSPSLRGDETILVVEDQDAVRKLTILMLRSFGYRTLEAAHGAAALELVENCQEPIHLLLTDVVMPNMTGQELANLLHPMRPAMKVLFMSGYAADVIANRGLLEPGLLFIAKPFHPDALALKVREALGVAAPKPGAEF